MGRGSKRRKEAAQQLDLRERSLRFWALSVRRQLRVKLGDQGDSDEWTLQACDANMEQIIVQNSATGKLKLIVLSDLVEPFRLEGLSLLDAESLIVE